MYIVKRLKAEALHRITHLRATGRHLSYTHTMLPVNHVTRVNMPHL